MNINLFVQGAESTFFSCYEVNTKQQYVSLPFPIALELPFLIESSSNETERYNYNEIIYSVSFT